MQLRSTAEQREQVPRVVVVHGELVGPRVPAGEQRGDAVERSLGDDAVVGEPGRASLERGKVGEADRIDTAVSVEQRVGRELVEHDDNRRGLGPSGRRERGRRTGERQLRGVRME